MHKKKLYMKNFILLISALIFDTTSGFAQTNASNFWNPQPGNFKVKHAIEVESLVPMFFTGGYHFAAGYRYKKFRVRASIINGGTYDAEKAGINNSSPAFKRYYKTSPGLFFGYNLWRNLELYTYLELHTFEITQTNTGKKENMRSTDSGLAISYQFFIGRYFYVQPGLHLYVRGNGTLSFDGTEYRIPRTDFSPVIRLGVRLWRRYP